MFGLGLGITFQNRVPQADGDGEDGTLRTLAGNVQVNPTFSASLQVSQSMAGTVNVNPLLQGGLDPIRILRGKVDANPELRGNLQRTVALRGTVNANPSFEADMEEPVVDYDSSADALFAAMTVQPTTARKGVIDDTILALKAAGVWAKLDGLIVQAAHHEQAGRINWISPTKIATVVGSPVFTADKGLVCTLGADGLTLTAPRASGSVMVSAGDSAVGTCYDTYVAGNIIPGFLGNTGTGSIVQMSGATPAIESYFWNGNNGATGLALVSPAAGMVITGMRRPGAPNNQLFFQDNTLRNTTTQAASGITLPANQIWLTGRLGTQLSRVRWQFFGQSLDNTQLAALISIMADYYAAL